MPTSPSPRSPTSSAATKTPEYYEIPLPRRGIFKLSIKSGYSVGTSARFIEIRSVNRLFCNESPYFGHPGGVCLQCCLMVCAVRHRGRRLLREGDRSCICRAACPHAAACRQFCHWIYTAFSSKTRGKTVNLAFRQKRHEKNRRICGVSQTKSVDERENIWYNKHRIRFKQPFCVV